MTLSQKVLPMVIKRTQNVFKGSRNVERIACAVLHTSLPLSCEANDFVSESVAYGHKEDSKCLQRFPECRENSLCCVLHTSPPLSCEANDFVSESVAYGHKEDSKCLQRFPECRENSLCCVTYFPSTKL